MLSSTSALSRLSRRWSALPEVIASPGSWGGHPAPPVLHWWTHNTSKHLKGDTCRCCFALQSLTVVWRVVRRPVLTLPSPKKALWRTWQQRLSPTSKASLGHAGHVLLPVLHGYTWVQALAWCQPQVRLNPSTLVPFYPIQPGIEHTCWHTGLLLLLATPLVKHQHEQMGFPSEQIMETKENSQREEEVFYPLLVPDNRQWRKRDAGIFFLERRPLASIINRRGIKQLMSQSVSRVKQSPRSLWTSSVHSSFGNVF